MSGNTTNRHPLSLNPLFMCQVTRKKQTSIKSQINVKNILNNSTNQRNN
jgi:hypothetical protein